MARLTAITVCKGRLAHLAETLPLLCALPDVKVIVVDYGCPEKAGAWVSAHFPQADVVYVPGDRYLNISKARNCGAARAETDYLLFVDADVRTSPEFIHSLRDRLDPDRYLTIDAPELKNDIRGTCVIPRHAFVKVGGYDEVLKEYGLEDIELYSRLDDCGITRKHVPGHAVSVIKHDDMLRTRFFEAQSIPRQRMVSIFYQQFTKAYRRTLNLPQLPLETRQQVHEASQGLIDKLLAASDASGGATIRTRIPATVPDGTDGADMDWQFQLTMTMKPKDPAIFARKLRRSKTSQPS